MWLCLLSVLSQFLLHLLGDPLSSQAAGWQKVLPTCCADSRRVKRGVSFEGRSLQLKVFQAGCYSLWTTLVKALVLTTLLESWLGGPLA